MYHWKLLWKENSNILWGYISYQGVELQRETKKWEKPGQGYSLAEHI